MIRMLELTWGQVMDPLLGKVTALSLSGWLLATWLLLLLLEGQVASSSKVARVKGAGGEQFKESMREVAKGWPKVARGKEKSRSSGFFSSGTSDQF